MNTPLPIDAWVALGVLMAWIGWFGVASVVLNGLRLITASPGLDRVRVHRAILVGGITAAVGLIFGGFLPKGLAPTGGPEIRIPLLWVVTSYTGWFVLLGVVMALIRAIQAGSAIRREDSAVSWKGVAGWLAFSAVSLLMFLETVQITWPWIGVALIVIAGMLYLEKHIAQVVTYIVGGVGVIITLAGIGSLGNVHFTPSDNTVQMFRGSLTLSMTNLVTIICLALVAFLAMAFLERSRRTRQWMTSFATYAALTTGTLIFGIPFAWLLVTSFKEDKDIASTEGLQWTPHVYVKGTYMDPKERHFAATFEGKSVDAILQGKPSGDKLPLEVYSPYALRGRTFEVPQSQATEVPREVPIATSTYQGQAVQGMVVEEMDNGNRRVQITEPESLKGKEFVALRKDAPDLRVVGLKTRNYRDALDYLPPETNRGLLYVKNTLFLVLMSVIGTVLSSTMVGYAFARLRFPGKPLLFNVLLSTMMLPAAVTMLPSFLIWKNLGAYDTLYPLWVGAFFGSAFNVFLIQQFFKTIPMELEEAAKIDGCTFFQTLMRVMVPQIRPVLVAVSVFTVKGVWDNFMGPLIYLNTPEKMPISYAVQLFQGDRGSEFGLMMAFSTMATLPMVVLFFFAQRYFIEGVTLSGLGGR